MRKMMVLPLAAALLLAAAAPVAAAANTSNSSGSGSTIQGEWWTESGSGYLYLFEDSSGDYGEIYEESGQWVSCSADPDDENYGFQGTRTYGWAYDIELTLGSKLSSGSATADVELQVETVDECAGTYDVSFDASTVSVNVTGVGSVTMFRDSGSFKTPGAFNQHSRFRGKERQAEGQLDLGSLGTRDLGFAIMAEFSWSDHSNG
jgi:hypothetical protein